MKLGYSESTGQYFDMDTGQPVNAAAAEAGPIESAVIGAGKALSNIPGLSEGLGMLGIGTGETPEDTGQYEQLKNVSPVATTVGEIAPGMVAPLRAGMMANTLYGGAQGSMLAEEGQRGIGAVLGTGGAALGDMAGRMVGRLGNMLEGRRAPQMGQVQTELTDSGYQLTPGQKTGEQSMMKLERSLEKTPQGQQLTGDMAEENLQLLQGRANEAVGLPADSGALDRNARDLAAEQIGNKMDQAADGVDVDVSEDLAARVSRIVKNDDMLELPEIPAGGQISGTDYMRVRSDLAAAQRSSQGSSRTYIGNTIEQLDTEFLAQATPEQAALYREAREQYKNLIQLEKGKALSSDGWINSKTAGNAFRGKQGYGARGVDNALPETRQLIKDLDNLGGRQVNPYIGNSGTPEGTMSLFDPKNWGQGLLAKKYYEKGGYMGGLMQNANPALPFAGAAAGRTGAGLLQDR